ncbi:hypothetical protein RHMOL_Rhmol04G0275900 [Rhododendron molle]|uniref:Uncharacterized protein n=1 Tax=Rhododendron molle TaxID=49168 RepID=A0ACC0P670_RHOML|nr:hypothetical protein RHMOL_Rhmol04G0275900 [Rhododendron molle]
MNKKSKTNTRGKNKGERKSNKSSYLARSAEFLHFQIWHPLGALYKRYGEAVVAQRGRALRTKVDSIIDQGFWKWPRQRNRFIMEIIRETPIDFFPNPSSSDKVVWTLTKDGIFTAKSAWEACRHRNAFQPWHTLVWFGQAVPRWSFIAWIAILGRLSTKDRLVSWGMEVSPQCSLCQNGVESHTHLFFECCFLLRFGGKF